jgi:hypothetical protein
MKLGRVVLDGSKVKANASKHKAMSYGRMQEDEKRLKEEVRRLLAQAEATDAEEDTRFGPDRSGDELLPELARRETRLKRRPTMPRLRWDLTSIRAPPILSLPAYLRSTPANPNTRHSSPKENNTTRSRLTTLLWMVPPRSPRNGTDEPSAQVHHDPTYRHHLLAVPIPAGVDLNRPESH